MVILYSTPTCGVCRVAENQLKAADVPHVKIDLTQHEDKAEELRERLDVPRLHLPVIEFEGELHTIADLPNIIRSIN